MALNKPEADVYISKINFTVFGICAIFFNALEIRLLVRINRKRSCFELILLSLGCADILTVIMFLANGSIMIILQDVAEHTSSNLPTKMTVILHYILRYMTPVVTFAVFSSIFHVGLLTLDRCIAVFFPLWHKIQVTKQRIGLALMAVWLCVSVITFVIRYLAGKKTVQIIIFGVILSVCTFMIAVYRSIVKKFKNSQSQMTWNNDTQKHAAKRRAYAKQERLIMFNSVAVTLCFTICFLPMSIYIAFSIKAWVLTVISLSAINAVIDPLIYFMFSYIKKVENRSL